MTRSETDAAGRFPDLEGKLLGWGPSLDRQKHGGVVVREEALRLGHVLGAKESPQVVLRSGGQIDQASHVLLRVVRSDPAVGPEAVAQGGEES